MKRIVTIGVITICLMTAGTFSSFAYEEVETTGDYFSAIGTKAGRGLWDVISSPAEIPCTMSLEVQDKGGTGYATGFGKGLFRMLRRILSGVTEFGTFIIPMERTLAPVCTEKLP